MRVSCFRCSGWPRIPALQLGQSRVRRVVRSDDADIDVVEKEIALWIRHGFARPHVRKRQSIHGPCCCAFGPGVWSSNSRAGENSPRTQSIRRRKVFIASGVVTKFRATTS